MEGIKNKIIYFYILYFMKKKSMIINIIFNAIKTVLNLLFPLITFPYASRVLGVENIGLVQYYNSIISYFIIFAGLGVSYYAVREGTKYRDDKDSLSKFSSELISILLITTFISYIMLFIIFFTNRSSFDEKLLVISSLSIMFSSLSLEWIYQIKEDFVYISLRSFCFHIISFISLILFVKSKNDYYIYAILHVISCGGSSILNILNSKKYITFLKVKVLDLKKHIKPILIIFGSSIATTIYMNMDTVMIGYINGSYDVGLYTVSVKVNQALKMLISSVSTVMLSRLSYYINTNQIHKYKQLLSTGVNSIFLILIPCAFGLIILSEQVIILFSGNEYIQASFASKILSINIIFSVIDTILYYQVLLPFKKEKEACFATIVGAVVNLVLNMYAIKYYSFNGAAVTTLLSEICVFIVLLYYANQSINIRKYINEIYYYIIASVPIFFIGKYCISNYSNYIITIFSTVFISIVIYIPIILIIKKEYILIIQNIRSNTLNRRTNEN